MKKAVKIAIIALIGVMSIGMLFGERVSAVEGEIKAGDPIVENVSGMPTIIELKTPQCVYCKQQEAVLKKVKETYKDSVDIKIIDITEEPSYGEKYQVKAVPAMIFIDSKGKQMAKTEGFRSLIQIQQLLNQMGND